MNTIIKLYTRQGCHLCEQAMEILVDLQSEVPFVIEEVDIEKSDDLTERYGLMIPVVEWDGEEIQYGQVDKMFIYEALTTKK
ncbi:glutaredoxin family protein [Cytobacillus spongiae]|uniref:glutaredoxin family protein n=1 Tax=Cytobacillus spongiae TaxID=2901381 RepID=UPI001F3F7D36|nr:glutaredoxin family protein [Cytobacillus spongiae]UII55552.1 glutaredoxin family protein [Cytobacillus spongiae]